MRERYQRFNPLDPLPLTRGPAYWRITDDTPTSMTITEHTDEYHTLPWSVGSEDEMEIKIRRWPNGEGGNWQGMEKVLREEDLLVFSDGSEKDGKIGYGIALYKKEIIGKKETSYEEEGTLSRGKTILDAEAYAII